MKHITVESLPFDKYSIGSFSLLCTRYNNEANAAIDSDKLTLEHIKDKFLNNITQLCMSVVNGNF